MSRGLYSWLLTGIVAFAAENETGSSAPPSLLRNSDFADLNAATGIPAGWRGEDWTAGGTVKIVMEPKGGPQKQSAARIVTEGGKKNVVMIQDLKLPGPGRYRLRLSCRPAPGCIAYASAVGMSAGKPLVYENTAKVSQSAAWTEQELVFVIPPEVESLRVLLRTNRAASFAGVSLVAFGDKASAINSRLEPSNARQLASKAVDLGYDQALDQARKAKMSPAQLAWEKTLEQNLGTFYLPRYKQAKEKGAETAWDYVLDDPALPRVLLIGDSISRGYTRAARQALAGKVNLHRAPANCGPTTAGLQKLDVWLGDGKWDLIHFNFGIHDRNSTPEAYTQRLEQIILRLKATGARVVFATSTPMPTDSETYRKGVCATLNQAALPTMARHGVPVNDLYAAILPKLAELQNPKDCHFNAAGYTLLGSVVAETILRELGAKGR
jgi:lysophospholipase L1-like esterase